MFKVEQGSRRDIYKLLAIVLSACVLAFILFLLVRQGVLDAKIKKLASQSLPSPQFRPTPQPSPLFTTPKGTEKWNPYTGKYDRYTVRYPSDYHLLEEGINKTRFVKDPNNSVFMNLEVRKLANIPRMNILLSPQDDEKLVEDLFTNNIGTIRDINKSSSRQVIKKISEGNLSGYPSIYFSDSYVSQTGQDTTHYYNRFLIRVDKVYYLLSQGGEETPSKLASYENVFKLFASSFVLY